MQLLRQRRKDAKKNPRSPFASLRLCGRVLLVGLLIGRVVPVTAFQPSNSNGAEAIFAEAEKLRSEQREDSNLRAIEKYREAATAFQNSGALKRSTVAFRNAGEVLQLLGNSAEALVCYQRAQALTVKTRDQLEQAKLLNDLSYLYFLDGKTKEAEKNARAALQLARTLSNRAIEAEALNNLGEALYGLGERIQNQQFEEQSLTIWRELNNPRGQAVTSMSLGYNYKNVGQPEKAFRSFAEALPLARQANDLAVECQALIALGNINRKTGNNQAALEWYEAAKPIAQRVGDQTAQAMVTGAIGYIYFEMGDQNQALPYVEEATKLFERNGK